jgi:GT2 family glycosyltransferase
MLDGKAMKVSGGVDLSIVIVNWNTRDYLLASVKSALLNSASISREIIVVDNASKDDSVKKLVEQFPDVCVIANRENVGFAAANNLALKTIRGKYVLLLNTDTVLHPHALGKAITYFQDHDRVGSIAPRVFNSDGTVQHPCYVKDPSLLNELVHGVIGIRHLMPRYGIRPADNRIREVNHATGACLFLRGEALVKTGFLDKRLYFSLEDADICLRIRKNGWHIVYVPECEVVHYGGGSRRNMSDNGIHAMLQSRYRFYKKHHGLIYATCVLAILAAGAVLRILVGGFLLPAGAPGYEKGHGQIVQGLQMLRGICRAGLHGKFSHFAIPR